MIDERHDERKRRHAVCACARRIVEAEPTDLLHSRHELAGVEPADHVTLGSVRAGAEIAAVEDAGVGMDAAAAITLETSRAAQ